MLHTTYLANRVGRGDQFGWEQTGLNTNLEETHRNDGRTKQKLNRRKEQKKTSWFCRGVCVCVLSKVVCMLCCVACT